MRKIIVLILTLLSINLVAMDDSTKVRRDFRSEREKHGKASRCTNCIDRHLSCDYQDPCSPCKAMKRENCRYNISNPVNKKHASGYRKNTSVTRKKRGPYAKQACENCRHSNAKCDGKNPCVRCTEGGKNCIYGKPRAKRKKITEIGPSSPEVEITAPPSTIAENTASNGSIKIYDLKNFEMPFTDGLYKYYPYVPRKDNSTQSSKNPVRYVAREKPATNNYDTHVSAKCSEYFSVNHPLYSGYRRQTIYFAPLQNPNTDNQSACFNNDDEQPIPQSQDFTANLAFQVLPTQNGGAEALTTVAPPNTIANDQFGNENNYPLSSASCQQAQIYLQSFAEPLQSTVSENNNDDFYCSEHTATDIPGPNPGQVYCDDEDCTENWGGFPRGFFNKH